MKRKAKERQAAILAKFAKQQKSFMQTSTETEAPEPMESHNDYETISAGSLCALCRSETPEGRILGLVGLIQPTKILRIAHSQDVGEHHESAPESEEYKHRAGKRSGEICARSWERSSIPFVLESTPVDSKTKGMEDLSQDLPQICTISWDLFPLHRSEISWIVSFIW